MIRSIYMYVIGKLLDQLDWGIPKLKTESDGISILDFEVQVQLQWYHNGTPSRLKNHTSR